VLVMKFGGSSVATASNIRWVAELVRQYVFIKQGDTPIIVASAMYGVTDCLLALARMATQSPTSCSMAIERVDALYRYHKQSLELVTEHQEEVADDLHVQCVALRNAIIKVSETGSLSHQLLDAITACGEKLSTVLVAAALNNVGIPAEVVSAEQVIITDATFGQATPDMATTVCRVRESIVPMVQRGVVPVVTGYVGGTSEGVTTTLGRNSSDYSAAILGAAVNAREIWLWKEVDGVLSANPDLVSEARLIPHLSFDEASALAHYGSQIIHPQTVRPAAKCGVPIRIKNTFNVQETGTLISNSNLLQPQVIKAITLLRDLAMIVIRTGNAIELPHGVDQALNGLSAATVNVLLYLTNLRDGTFSLIIRGDDLDKAITTLSDALQSGLSLLTPNVLEIRAGVAMISLIGNSLNQNSTIASRFWNVLRCSGVELISTIQQSSDASISCVVQDEDGVVRLLRIIHGEFIQGIHR